MRLRVLRSRGALAVGLSIITLVVCISIAAWSTAGILANAICILIVSLMGFHGVAWVSYERKLVWQILDYTLELITVVSLIAALAGIQQSAVAEMLQAEFSRRKSDQSSLLYSIKSTITNDCHSKESRMNMWTPSPEPYPGACDRVEHFLPQIEYAFGKETGAENMAADDSWAKGLLVAEESATGSWAGLYSEAKRFIESTRKTQHVLEVQGQLSSDFLKTLAGSGKLLYWQYLLAFTFGVRIARKTGSLLDARVKERISQESQTTQTALQEQRTA